MIIAVVQLRESERKKERGRERHTEKKERWRKTDAKLTSLNISYQTQKETEEKKKTRSSFNDGVSVNVQLIFLCL